MAERRSKLGSDDYRTNSCIDWYLVTTVYYSDGSNESSSIYLFTTCDGECNQTRSAMGRSYQINCGGGGGSQNDIVYEYAITKPVTWEVAISSYGFWRVMSTEQIGGRRVADEPQGGHFTNIVHQVSFLQFGNDYSWQELSNTATLDNDRLAKSYVQGKLITPSGTFITLNNTLSETFQTIFGDAPQN